MSQKTRRNELHSRRGRHWKLKSLRVRFASAKTNAEKERILDKVSRVAPGVSRERFTAAVKAKS